MAFPKELQIYLQEKLLRTCALIGEHKELRLLCLTPTEISYIRNEKSDWKIRKPNQTNHIDCLCIAMLVHCSFSLPLLFKC